MEATVIYPHQLFTQHPALQKNRPVFLVEEALILTHNPIHRQKLVFHKLTMDAYEKALVAQGFAVTRLGIHDYPSTASIFAFFQQSGVTILHVVDTTDDYLEAALNQSDFERVWYESPLFLLTREDATKRYHGSKRHLASFYKQLRRDWSILITDDGEPVGGRWSYDDENRKKLPKGVTPPTDPELIKTPEVTEAVAWAATVPARQYGTAGCWLPVTASAAEAWLQVFLTERLAEFGPYEDALSTNHHRLWHSMLSPLLNIGLITAQEVLDATLMHAQHNTVPLASLEGFVRQIIGWREFIRAAYEADGAVMRTTNFFNHSQPLPESFWTGTTGLLPVDSVITQALAFGYNHHIERLMVIGNAMLLCKLHPDAAYEWFMAMYIDAYDWVMVPNVYGMSQFADGGSFATKPYISGSNYLKKMSDYPKGEWETIFTALYWAFIRDHEAVFARNHRLSMMPRLLTNMPEEKRKHHFDTANQFLKSLHQK